MSTSTERANQIFRSNRLIKPTRNEIDLTCWAILGIAAILFAAILLSAAVPTLGSEWLYIWLRLACFSIGTDSTSYLSTCCGHQAATKTHDTVLRLWWNELRAKLQVL